MKNKIIFGSIVLGIVLLVSAGVYFLGKDNSVADLAGNTANELADNAGKSQMPEQDSQAPDGGIADSGQAAASQLQNKLVTDDFEMNIPSGWIQAQPMAGTSAIVVNTKESLNDPAVKKINFKSYFAVSYDVFQGKSLDEYSETIKNGLRQTVQGVVFANEHDIVVNGRPARAFEAEMSQQGVNFRVLMVLVKGEGDDAWVLSFDTTKSAWDGYAQTFSDIVNSFKLKK